MKFLRKAKADFFDKLNPQNMKQFWRSVKQLNKRHTSIPVLHLQDCTAESNTDKATMLNTFFSTCFNNDIPPLSQHSHLFPHASGPAPDDLLCSEEEVLYLIKSPLLISDHLHEFHLLADNQWGFQPGKSTTTALLSVTREWLQALDAGLEVCAVYSVPHRCLLEKLAAYGFNHHILSWVQSYLTSRVQHVRVGGKTSGEVGVQSGVPQGFFPHLH